MSSGKYILTIDLGTSGPKVALFSLEGGLIGSEFQENHVHLLPNGGAEQSPAEWWGTINMAVKRLLGKSLIPSEDIIAVATTGQWSGTVAVDREGSALGNAVIWMDSRGEPYVKKITGGPVKVEGYGADKLFKWVRLTGGLPGSSGKDPIAHILYLKHTHPEIYQNTYKFLEPLGLIGFPLTAGFVSKWYLVKGALDAGMWGLAAIVLFGSILALVYVWKLVETIYFKEPEGRALEAREAPLSMLIPMWFLIGLSIYFGIDSSFTSDTALRAAKALLGGAP